MKRILQYTMNIANAYLRSSRAQRVLNRKPSEAGFSLIELVVVVAVLAVISAIAIPAFTDVSRRAATSAAKQSLASFYGQCGAERADQMKWTDTAKTIAINGYSSKEFKCSDTSWEYKSKAIDTNPDLKLTLENGKKDCTSTANKDSAKDCPW